MNYAMNICNDLPMSVKQTTTSVDIICSYWFAAVYTLCMKDAIQNEVVIVIITS